MPSLRPSSLNAPVEDVDGSNQDTTASPPNSEVSMIATGLGSRRPHRSRERSVWLKYQNSGCVAGHRATIERSILAPPIHSFSQRYASLCNVAREIGSLGDSLGDSALADKTHN